MRKTMVMTTSSSSTGRFRGLLALLLAAAVAAGLLVLVQTKPAEAAFPGDNGKIAFSSNRATGDGVNNPTGDYEIFTMNPDGTEVTQLTDNDLTAGNDEQPAWSSDGTKIVFRSERDGNWEIYVMDAVDADGDGNGDNPTRLTNNAGDDIEPAWSPDGTKIAFRSSRVAGNPEVYVMNAKDEINNETGDPGPDGNGDNLTNLTNNAADDIEPAWSANGKKIAFTSNRDVNYEVYVMNALDGSKQKRSIKNAANDFSPAWAPKGNKIAFTSNRDGDDEVYVKRKNLTNNVNVNDMQPAWSPDRKKIAFQSDQDGNFEIFTMNSNGTGRTNISNTAAAKDNNGSDAEDIDPDWQPIVG